MKEYLHQDGHNTLADLDEPVPETKKVTDFLSGITDPRLNNSKDVILGDVAKLQDFEACQQYLKTLVFNKSKHERHIAGVHSPHDGGKQRGTKHKGGKHKPTKGSTKNYTKEEWFMLLAEQGLAQAQYKLGNMYEKGWGVPKDQKQAVIFYKKAADQGDEEAINTLKNNTGSAQSHEKIQGELKNPN